MRSTAFQCALLVALMSGVVAGQIPDTVGTIDAAARVRIASTIYHEVLTFFPDLSRESFDSTYGRYVDDIVSSSPDRRRFDLASMALIATLHDSHTWFYDDWLDTRFGQATGLVVYRLSRQWVVVRSRRKAVRPGDVIVGIDGESIDAFFDRQRKYISASSERDATTSLFDTPALFPSRFAIHFASGRSTTIDRAQRGLEDSPPIVNGRWLDSGRVGYIQASAFQGIQTNAEVWQYVSKYAVGRAIILDLRGNVGGGDPRGLQQALMADSYPTWSEHAAMSGGAVLRGFGVAHPGAEHEVLEGNVMQPHGSTYHGRLIILTDRGCTCACEDFLMPFKVTHRAMIVGEASAGTFSFTSQTQFGNGMRLNVAAVRHTYPDGSRFEGVGIVPDVAVEVNAAQLSSGRDPVLEAALRLIR